MIYFVSMSYSKIKEETNLKNGIFTNESSKFSERTAGCATGGFSQCVSLLFGETDVSVSVSDSRMLSGLLIAPPVW